MVLMVLVITVNGCISIPEPYPFRTITYELNKDSQKWTQQDCTTNHKAQEKIKLQTVCYRETIAAPPEGVVKAKSD
jgi:hypothetical protein